MKLFHSQWRILLSLIAFAIAFLLYPYAPGALSTFRCATASALAGVVLLVDKRTWYLVVGEYLASGVGLVLFEMLGDWTSPAPAILGAFVGWIVAAIGLRLLVACGKIARLKFAQAMAEPASRSVT